MSIPKVKWQNTMPTEAGIYWFYGELEMGSMGRDYQDDYVHEPEMTLVTILNNEIATANGQIIFRKPFDKENRKTGWLGYWANAELPSTPYDGDQLFNTSQKPEE